MKRRWTPKVVYHEPSWNVSQKHDEMIDVLLTGRFPVLELQDYLDIKPTEEYKSSVGKYGHVIGIAYLLTLSRVNGWDTRVMTIDGESWAFLPEGTR